MRKAPKEIDLPPTEYAADMPNKPEPVFGSGALEWGLFIASWVIVATAVHFVKLAFR